MLNDDPLYNNLELIETPFPAAPYIRCVACDRWLGDEAPYSHDGLCSPCRKTLQYYDYPYIEIQYVCGTLTEGIVDIPADLYDGNQ